MKSKRKLQLLDINDLPPLPSSIHKIPKRQKVYDPYAHIKKNEQAPKLSQKELFPIPTPSRWRSAWHYRKTNVRRTDQDNMIVDFSCTNTAGDEIGMTYHEVHKHIIRKYKTKDGFIFSYVC